MSVRKLAEDVRSGNRSARSITEEHLVKINEREPEIHAFNLVLAEQALARADEIDAAVQRGEDPGPLAGIPVALKDNICTSGIPTTCSSKILEGWKPPYDATVTNRLRDAGAVIVGKTNLDEFAMGSSTENSAFGPTKNPHDITRTPGGSSGGSAAAIAAGFAPLSIGSDTGGSIRQPASFCGVVGIKPTYGRVSRYGLIAFASSLDQIGPFGATVEDAAFGLGALAGYDRMDSTSVDAPVPDYVASLGEGVEGLRIGVISEMMGEGINSDVRSRVEAAIAALESNGAKVGEVSVPATRYGLSAYYLIAPAEASSNLARYDGVRYGLRNQGNDIFDTFAKSRSDGFGSEVKRRIMLGTYSLSSGYYDAYYAKAQRVRTLIIRDFEAAYQQFDLLVSPTAPSVAFPFGQNENDPLAMYMNDVCTIPTNLAGHPAVSVPFGTGEANMPVGVQILAPPLGEATMLRAAAVLEKEASA